MRCDLLSTSAASILRRARRSTRAPSVLAILIVALISARAGAQSPASGKAPSDPIVAAIASAARAAQRTDEPATLVYANRRIVELRATILSRTPAARAAAASAALDRLVPQVPDGEVTTHAYEGGTLVSVGGRPVFAVLAADVDPLAGEQLDTKVADAASRLTVAFREAGELRSPRQLLSSVMIAIAATVFYVLLLWMVIRLDTRVAAAAGRAMERRLRALPGGEVMVGAHAPLLVQRLVRIAGGALALLFTYSWVTIVLRRFPYTRPWGETLKATLYATVTSGARRLLDHLPDLLTVLLIVVVTRFAVRLVSFAFRTVEDGRVSLPGVYPETAQPTRRIAVALLWIFALVVCYEFLPGAKSDAFKGVSVFIGLIISLGSSGIMNQVMSGLMVTYSRAVRVGDFVRIGDVEGTVTQLGTLSTKIKTPRNEEVTLPNALVVSQAATNYSRHAADGVLAPATITIGYDVPWRQVQSLLLIAAERTPGVRKAPAPVVLQTALGDFAVEYKVLVCVDQPHRRLVTLNALHANIQDAFNYYGVQIMSPAYEADPGERKTVPPSRWYSAPAREPSPAPASAYEVALTARAPQRPAREA
jgi:small-conductance mechanosensitive channel